MGARLCKPLVGTASQRRPQVYSHFRSSAVPLAPCFGSSNRPMCVLAQQNGAAVHAQKVYCLTAMLSMQPCIESGTLSLRKRASRTVKVFSGFMHSSAVFRGCSPQQAAKNVAVAQKIRRRVGHILCCALAGGFRAHAFLKSACTDFVGGGLVQARLSWSGLAVAGEPAALHNHLL